SPAPFSLRFPWPLVGSGFVVWRVGWVVAVVFGHWAGPLHWAFSPVPFSCPHPLFGFPWVCPLHFRPGLPYPCFCPRPVFLRPVCRFLPPRCLGPCSDLGFDLSRPACPRCLCSGRSFARPVVFRAFFWRGQGYNGSRHHLGCFGVLPCMPRPPF